MKLVSWLVVSLFAAGAASQDGAALPSKNYRVQFENDWVKVTAVRYGPREKVAEHAHTPYPSAYVYLNDGPPVVFSHVGGKPATRAATKAGAFRIYRGLQEVHEALNTGDVASEFLRVELKTEGREVGSFFGKYERGAPSVEPTVHFNHPQVAISRVWIQPGAKLALATDARPALLIALQSAGGFKAGEERFLGPSSSTTLSNTGTAPIDFLRFDLKTMPAAGTR